MLLQTRTRAPDRLGTRRCAALAARLAQQRAGVRRAGDTCFMMPALPLAQITPC